MVDFFSSSSFSLGVTLLFYGDKAEAAVCCTLWLSLPGKPELALQSETAEQTGCAELSRERMEVVCSMGLLSVAQSHSVPMGYCMFLY